MRRTRILPALSIVAASGCSKKERASTEADTPPDTEGQPTARPDGPPNIVIFLLDDTGYADFGAYGSEINTPNIDRLAANGVQFSNHHGRSASDIARALGFEAVARLID